MNALISHLRFLRPLRSALVAAIYASIAVGVGQRFLRLDPGIAQLSASLVALPLLVGILLAGAAHEPLHRAFAPILPGLRERQLRFAAISTTLAALAITAISVWTASAVSPVASLGLVTALLALPHLDSHRLRGVLSGPCSEIIVWLLLSYAFALGLSLTLNAGPWLCLLCGLAFAAFALRQGYSRSGLRLRSHLPFVAYQTRFFVHVFNPAIAERWQAETVAIKCRQSKPTATPGSDWRLRVVGPATRDWLRVFWHAQFGAREGSPFTSRQLSTAGFGIGFLFCLPAIEALARNESYLTRLSRFTSSGPSTNIQFIVGAATVLSLLPPRLAYPISRVRLGQIVFWQAVTLWAVALVLPVVILLLPSLFVQAASENYLPGYGLPTLLTRTLFLAVLLPLIVAIGTLVSWGSRISKFAGVFIALITGKLIQDFFGNYVPNTVEVLAFLLATAVSLALLRYRLHRHYATYDLVSGAAATIRSP